MSIFGDPAPQGEKRRDSKGREHAADCTFEEPAKFPACTCGAWPALHLNSAEVEGEKERYLGFGTDDEEAWDDPDITRSTS